MNIEAQALVQRGMANPKLTFVLAEEIRRRCKAGEDRGSVAAAYGIDRSHVCNIVNGRSWARDYVPSESEMRANATGRRRREAERLQVLRRMRRCDSRAVVRNRLEQHNRRGRGKITVDEWLSILEVFGHRCAYCGVYDKLSIDHVTPFAMGGTNSIDNVVPACGSCNFVKGHDGPLAMVNRNYQFRTA